MRSGQWNEATLSKLQDLIEANFTGRDELYAAAKTLCDADRQQVCCRLAEHLADHAIELQQIVAANGGDPVEPSQFSAVAEALFERVRTKRGAAGVIDAAEESEQAVKAAYDVAIQETDDKQAEGLLKRHRGDVEFGGSVLRSMRPTES